jgi:DNA gyrase subunit B
VSNYNANTIETLEFKDAVRKRIAMYMGSADNNGILQCIREVVSNSIDEFTMGYGNKIIIELFEGNRFKCADYGRGIPFGKREDGSEALQAALTMAHSGGKFNNKTYQSVIGMNGIGIKGVALSSSKFSAEVCRNGEQASVLIEKGIAKPMYITKTTREDGTIIEFVPDGEVYNLEPVHINFDDITDMCENWSYLTKGLKFEVHNKVDLKNPIKKVFYSKGGIIDLISDIGISPIHKTPIYHEHIDGEIHVEIACQWTTGRENAFVFTNRLLNVEGGTSLTGFRTTLTRKMNKLIGKTLTGEMIRTGLVYVISVMIPNASFANQTKTKVNNPELRTITGQAVADALEIFSKKYYNEFDKIISFLTQEEKAERAAQRARNAVLNSVKNTQDAQKKKVFLADKLKDCEEHGDDSMLVVCEGDSALGALAQGRPVENVALMPIRGKIINALRHDIDETLENNEVKDIITTLGCGIQNMYKSKKLRYGKLAIATDADADGYNIMCLITTLIYYLLPKFLEEGRLYWLRAPLFKIKSSNDVKYAFNEEELNEIIKTMNGTITRLKGLGEMSPLDTKKSMFGEFQRLEQLIIEDKTATYEQIECLMGEDVAKRRKFIFENINFDNLVE